MPLAVLALLGLIPHAGTAQDAGGGQRLIAPDALPMMLSDGSVVRLMTVDARVRVVGVTPGVPGADAAFRVGDVMEEMAGSPVTTLNALIVAYVNAPADRPIPVLVRRGSQSVGFEVEKHPDAVAALRGGAGLESGWVTREAVESPGSAGGAHTIRIAGFEVGPGADGAPTVLLQTPAPENVAIGLRPHDVILAVNGDPVAGFDAFRERFEAISAGATVSLRVARGDAGLVLTFVKR